MLRWVLDFLLNTKRWEQEQEAYLRQVNYGENYIYPGFVREEHAVGRTRS